jgi:putative hemolysin
MKHTVKLFSLFLSLAMILSACAPATPTKTPTNIPAQSATETAPTLSAAIANPAAKYCADQGFKSEIRTATDGSQYGVCKFPDGTECEEWAYSRGVCKAGQYPVAPAPTPGKPNPGN